MTHTPTSPPSRRGLLFTAGPLVLFSAVIAAAVITGAWLTFERYEDERDDRIGEVETEASASARQLEQFFDERFEALNAIAASPIVTDGTPDEAKAYFERVVAEGSSFSGGLSIIGTDGVMVLLSGFPLGEPPIDLSDRDYVQAVLATDAPAIGNAIVGRRSGDPLLTFAVPIRQDGGTTTGILAGTIRLDIDAAGLSQLALPLDDVIVLDPANQLVINRGLVETIDPADPELLAQIDGVEDARTGVELPGSGEEYVAAVAPVGPSQWRMIVARDEDELLGAARRSLAWQLALLGVLAAGGVLAVAGFAWQRRTDLKVREQSHALRASEDRLAAAMHIAPVVLATVDNGLRYTWIFNAAAPLSADDVIGKTDMELASADDVRELMRLKSDALQGDSPVRRQVSIRTNGEWRTYDMYAQPVRDSSQRTVGLITAGIDVTDAARREEKLRDALHAKDEFLSLVSHELRTPMTIIAGNTRLLAHRRDALDEAAVDTALIDVDDAAARLSRIIDDLLILARPESGEALETEPLPVARMIAQAVQEHRRVFASREITITTSGAAPFVMADRGCLQQVLQNLLSNAEKYSPGATAIDIEAWSEGGETMISVADRGIGVSEDDAARLFEPFFRTQDATETARGIGVGLAVCRRLTEAMGGRIWAQPRDGSGTTFLLALAVADVDDIEDGDVIPPADDVAVALEPA